jgi:hypothetical protein
MGPWGHLVQDDVSWSAPVKLTTVDSLLSTARVGRVDLLKIDVEGAELEVLRGMTRVLAAEPVPAMIIECCPFTLEAFGHTAAELVSFLEEHGYVAYTVGANRLIRRRPEEVQVTTVTDLLVVRNGVRRLEGWSVEPPMQVSEIVQRVVEESHHPVAQCRASLARAARRLDPTVLALPDVSAALAHLSRDDSEAVRDACAWWSELREAPGAMR